MNDRGMSALAHAFEERDLHVVRFDFPYVENGSRRPDPMPVLEARIADVASRVRIDAPDAPLVLGGRSMGGRAASMLVARGFACAGLLLLAYPLHPAGKPERLRDAHLAKIAVPTLCLNGTRDTLCRRELMDTAVSGLGGHFRMHWIEGADHGFHVLKSAGRTDDDVRREIGEVVRNWLDRAVARPAQRA